MQYISIVAKSRGRAQGSWAKSFWLYNCWIRATEAPLTIAAVVGPRTHGVRLSSDVVEVPVALFNPEYFLRGMDNHYWCVLRHSGAMERAQGPGLDNRVNVSAWHPPFMDS